MEGGRGEGVGGELRVSDFDWHSLSSLDLLSSLILLVFFFALLFHKKLLSIHWTHLLWSYKRCMANARVVRSQTPSRAKSDCSSACGCTYSIFMTKVPLVSTKEILRPV